MEDIQHQQMGYDRAATMFAPDGHILQVEYAEKTVRLGSASIGILGKDCVVIISDRRQKDNLIIENSVNKIHEVDEHIIAISAGITSDARVLVEKARMIAQQHRMTYDSAPSTESVIRDVADIQQQFTQYGGVRPFGVSMMFGGYNGEPTLYTVDVTGNYSRYKANAIGENDEKIKRLLREKYTKDLSSHEAIKLGLNIFKEVQGDDFSIDKFDVGIVKEGKIEKIEGKKLAH
ncbi:MAG: archaeal proteasome endopeptidase complex subunit alpha [Nanoarchaeota archaeon]|nr:archaeal proteasome endopeptidase complex subunit alpha [Nanoarchaeota archaeon]